LEIKDLIDPNVRRDEGDQEKDVIGLLKQKGGIGQGRGTAQTGSVPRKNIPLTLSHLKEGGDAELVNLGKRGGNEGVGGGQACINYLEGMPLTYYYIKTEKERIGFGDRDFFEKIISSKIGTLEKPREAERGTGRCSLKKGMSDSKMKRSWGLGEQRMWGKRCLRRDTIKTTL